MRIALSFDEVIRRAHLGLALNLGQLATASGYGYSTVQKWHKMGMPLLDGRITLQDAIAWRKACAAVGSPRPDDTILHHPLLSRRGR
jgi:hypothetical protein